MRLRRIRGALSLLSLMVFARPSSLFSQQEFDPLEQFNANGFDQNRDYFSGLPVEHIDPMTGNLILTFTDLVLPGNAGFDLKIQRVYNSKIYRNFHSMGDTLGEDSPAGVGWSIHLGRVLDPEGTPLVEMSDGSRHPTYRHIDGTGRFITKEYWVYNQNLSVPTLSLTNGVVYKFGAHIGGVRHVTEIADPFGNRIVVTYGNAAAGEPADGIKTIWQYLSSTVTRVVTFSYETGVARKNLKTISYSGEKAYTWTYVHTTVPVQGPLHSLLKEVKPPIGPSWLYQYNESTSPRYELTRATAPGGGYTNYSYSTVAFYNPGSVQIVNSRAVTGKSIAGYDIAAGSWSFSYAQGSNKDQSTFTTPCGTIKYEFLGIGNQTFQVEAWQVGLQKSKQILSGATVLEQEVFVWKKGAPISTDPFITGLRTDADTWVPLLEERVVTRGGQTFRTTNSYGTGNFNDFGRPNQVVETGDRTRTTDYTFDYNFTSSLYLKDRIASETVSEGGTTLQKSFVYVDSTGFKSSETLYGVTTTFSSGSFGNVDQVTDASGKATNFSYEWGVLKNTTTSAYTIQRSVVASGLVSSVLRRGLTTAFGYDTLFRITTIDPPLGLDVVYSYDNSQGRWMQLTRGVSNQKTDLDGFGRPSATSNAVSVKTDMAYDSCGRMTYQSYPFTGTSNIGTSFQYDPLGRVTRRTHPDGATISYDYDGIDVTITNERGLDSTQDWEAYGDPGDAVLTGVIDRDGQTWSYDYDVGGNLTLVNPPGTTATRTWTYNTKNQLTSETHPESGTTSYTYYANGKLQTKTDPAFGTTAFTYDGNNRLVLIDWPGPGSTALGYDDSDNRTLLENESIRSTFGYDDANRLISRQELHKANLSTWTAGFGYDTRDNLTRINYPTESGARLSVDYTYDNGNRISRIAEVGGTNEVFADSFTYHPSGGVLQYLAGNGITHKFEYHASRYWVDDVYDLGGPEQVLDLAYVYDAAGNVESISDSRPGMSQQFTYDNLDRLATASGPWGGHDYGYDSEGNITGITRTGGPSTTFNYSGQTMRLTHTTGGGAAAFGYDANGNMKTAGSDAFFYTPQNMMSSSTVSGVSAAYGYDGDNLRKLKASGTATRQYFHGPGDLLLSEFETSCGNVRVPVRDYVYAGSRLVASMKHNLDPPVPTAPGAATNDATPTFQWEPVLGATEYRLILKNQAGQTVLDKSDIASESFVSTVTLSEGTYRWQVQAGNATVQSCFSDESDFEVDLTPPAPVTNLVLSAPSPGRLNLTWTATGDNGLSGTASAYDVRYSVGSTLNYPIATQATNEPAPAASGTMQTFLLTGLSNDTVYSVALTVIDDAGNASAVSNVATRATLDVSPPEAIGNLAASNPTLDSIRLQWTAPHEDGTFGGGASVYDIRRSTSPITGANFQAAVPVAGAPSPAAPGVVQSMTVSGLLHTTRYYFAIKSIDFDGNLSPISNVVSIDTLDGTPPSAVTNLTALADTNQQESVVTAVAASGEEGASTKAKAVDGIATSFWSTPGRTAMQDEFITLDTGALRPIGRVRMLSPSSGALFPENLRVEVSNDNVSFLTVAERTGLPATQALWHTIDFVPNQGRYVRIYITKTRLSGGGLYYARIAEIDVFETTTIAGAIEIAWTAPGDDGLLGTATAYDLRYGTSPITDANFGSALPIPTASPLTAGSGETVTVMGLSDEARFYFALKTRDDRANVSPLSNVAVAATLGTPPAPVTDLLASNPTASSIRLSWTATGDDGTSGSASSYDLRYSTAPITAAGFSQAIQVAGIPAPLASGAPESFTVGSLSGGTTYYFAIKVADELGNSSPINVNGPVTATTLDAIAPSAVTNLAATFAGGGPLIEVAAPAIAASGEEGTSTKAKATDNVVTSYWSSPGRSTMQDEFITFDTGAVRSIGRVKLLSPSSGALFPEDLRVELSSDNVSFVVVAERTGLASTQGLWHTIDFPAGSGRYVRIYVTKTRLSGGGLYYARIAEVDVFESAVGPTDVYVTWTAPGDDGMAGTASSYDLRYSTTSIGSVPQFEAATPVTGEPAPSVSGASQTMTVSNAPQGVLLYFALRTLDDSGNVSGLSNVASVQTGFPDTTAPAAIGNLTAVLETVQQEVALTAVAASGEEGTSTKEKALDGVTTSFWSTPGRSTMQNEYITLDTGAVRSIGRVRLLSPSSGALFPEDLRVELSIDNVSFTTAATRTGLPATQALWHTIDFGPSPGRYVRIYITKTRLSGGGLYYARIAEIEAFETTSTGAVQLSWTAPGDDGNVGIAASYDVRRSGSPIATEAAFQSATAISGEPAPQGAGAQQSFLVNGLSAGTYHFAIKTTDEAGNASTLSNNASVTIP